MRVWVEEITEITCRGFLEVASFCLACALQSWLLLSFSVIVLLVLLLYMVKSMCVDPCSFPVPPVQTLAEVGLFVFSGLNKDCALFLISAKFYLDLPG